jgi:hypothetical protein
MPYVIVTAVLVTLAIYIVPVLLLQKKRFRHSHDYFVASGTTPPGVFQNSAIAYALQMATFGPFFLWGAASDYWPAILNSLFFGLGLWVLYRLRHRLFAFLDDALKKDESITVHEFMARQHGNSQAVRIFASCLTIFALLGLVLGEILGIAALLKPVLLQNVDATYTFIFSMLLMMFLYTIISGNTGVMRSDQAQMGIAYVGLFGASALLFFVMPTAARNSGPVALASLALSLIVITIVLYRKGRFLDTTLIPLNDTDEKARQSRGDLAGVKVFRTFERALNVAIIFAAAALVWYAVSSVAAIGLGQSLAKATEALSQPTKFSLWGYVALILLPLFYQAADITNWQRIASQVKNQESANALNPDDSLFRRVFLIYSVESPLIWIFMCLFGGLAVSALGVPTGDTAFPDLVTKILQAGTRAETGMAILLITAVFAIGLSTMNSVFSATLLAVRDDLLPAIYRPAAAETPDPLQEQEFIRKTAVVGVVFYTIIVSGFYVADGVLKIKFGSDQFLAILFAFYCAQLAFVPLILGPLWKGKDGLYGTLTPPWALVVLATGAFAGVVSQVVFLSTGNDAWLWGAVPLCLVVSWSTFAFSRLYITTAVPRWALISGGAIVLFGLASGCVYAATGNRDWLWGLLPFGAVCLWTGYRIGPTLRRKRFRGA